MHPNLIAFAGLLSLTDALAITTTLAATRKGFPAIPQSTSSVEATRAGFPADLSVSTSAVRAGFAAIPSSSSAKTTSSSAKTTSSSVKTTSSSVQTTSSSVKTTSTLVKTTSTAAKTTSTSAKTSTTTTSMKPTTTSTTMKTTSTKPTTTSTTTLAKTTTTSKTTTTASPTATALGTTSTKRGLCWPYNNPASSFNLFSPSSETWIYNWEMWSPTGGTSFASAQYVGMVRDPSRLSQISWYYTPTSRVSPYLLGFNEPDLPGDTFVTVADAVTYWQQYFLPLRKAYGTILGAPAVTNAVAANWGIDWLNQFNNACSDTTTTPGTPRSCFDFIPLHWYGYYLSDFQNYVINFHNVYPFSPLWITEFAFTDQPASEVQTLAKQAIEWLDTQSYVVRYSMFGPMNAANMAGITGAAMVTDDLTALTNVGKVYHGVL